VIRLKEATEPESKDNSDTGCLKTYEINQKKYQVARDYIIGSVRVPAQKNETMYTQSDEEQYPFYKYRAIKTEPNQPRIATASEASP
jgi:hypothetical protein